MFRTTTRVAALLAVAVAAALAIGAGSASAATLLVTDTGAGSVIETTSAQNMYCQTPADQSNQEHTDCEENYGLGWIVELHTVPAPGYDFDGWQGVDNPTAVQCDGADSNHYLASGNCRFQMWFTNLALWAKFTDRTPPETTITTGPSGSTQSPSAQFAFAASQNRSTFQCSLDGSAWASCASPKPYGGPLSDGQHTFAVRAIDASGNVGPTPAARTWSVEAPPSPPGDLHVTGYGPNTINLAWTASTDNTSTPTYVISVNGYVDHGTGITSTSVTGLACATHFTLAVQGIDADGNLSSPATVEQSTSACLDTTPPTAPGAPQVASHTQTTLGIDWQAATDAGGIETYQVYVNGALDGTSAVTPYVIDGLSCGTTYTVGVEAVDFAENHSPRTTAQLSTDACAAPTGATIDVSAKLSKPTKLAVSWSADNADTVASWDVRQQTAPWNGGLGAATTWLSATQLTAKSYDPGQGKTVCFSVRARDAAGHTSAWSTPDCESTPLDDRALTPVGAWQKLSDSSHFAGTALQTQTAGDSLTLTGVHARGFSLIADRGPTAGTLRVEWNGTVMGTVKLKAARAKPAWVELLIQLGTPQTGTLKLTATTTGKPVTIDALNVFGD